MAPPAGNASLCVQIAGGLKSATPLIPHDPCPQCLLLRKPPQSTRTPVNSAAHMPVSRVRLLVSHAVLPCSQERRARHAPHFIPRRLGVVSLQLVGPPPGPPPDAAWT